ncbi:rab-gtpase-tbc domain-containing protein-related [Anaeramoeba flamelloides]|uniref:Rab-gtpase-tbc domain-containing protein-related n=1 Tax=Anaeramoeba flamelloides TaxID=1746091 RepID=A0AAV7Y741_9EUKA|nr:rab-gtpase-tbc domain-containing protein-related [Anaeramoeba flamelloides]
MTSSSDLSLKGSNIDTKEEKNNQEENLDVEQVKKTLETKKEKLQQTKKIKKNLKQLKERKFEQIDSEFEKLILQLQKKQKLFKKNIARVYQKKFTLLEQKEKTLKKHINILKSIEEKKKETEGSNVEKGKEKEKEEKKEKGKRKEKRKKEEKKEKVKEKGKTKEKEIKKEKKDKNGERRSKTKKKKSFNQQYQDILNSKNKNVNLTEELQIGFEIKGKKELVDCVQKLSLERKSQKGNGSKIQFKKKQVNFGEFGKFDRYGFLIDKNIQQKEYEEQKKKEIDTIPKWLELIKQWDHSSQFNRKKLKKMMKISIPDCVRGAIWERLLQTSSQSTKKKNHKLYSSLLEKNHPDENQIYLDINRTFNLHQNYREGSEQLKLFELMKRWCNCRPDIGYVQGMSYIGATLLLYLDEQTAFWGLITIMKKYNLEKYYNNEFYLVRLRNYQFTELLKNHQPKLSSHFAKFSIQPVTYSMKWYLTLYSGIFDFNFTIRIWDFFFLEGDNFLLKMALSIMIYFENEILKFDFENFYLFFNDLKNQKIDYEQLLKICLSLKLKKKKLDQLEQEFKNGEK